jgi:hypothetical protein
MPLPSPSSFPVWLIPNVLSLDAPLIAVAWQALLASRSGTTLRPAGRAILFLTVWLIYIVDRLLDVRVPAVGPEPARHRFYREHGRAMSVLAVIVLVVDATLIIFELHPAVFRVGLVTFAGVCVYFALVHGTALRFPKEIVVAWLFTMGTFLVAFARSEGRELHLLIPALALFLLALANLVAIEYGEGGGSGMVRALGRWYLVWVGALALTAPLALPGRWFFAIGMAAAVLVMVHVLRERLGPELRRVLVDLALFIPPLLLL